MRPDGASDLDEVRLLRERVDHLSRLIDVSVLVSSTLNLDEVMARVLSLAKELMQAEASSIMLWNEELDALEFKVVVGGAEVEKLQTVIIKKGQGIAGTVAATGEPLLVADVRKDPRFFAHVDEVTGFVTKSILAAPLIVQGEIVGVAEVLNHSSGRPFTERDLELFASFCRQVAVGIRSARAFSIAEKQASRLATLNELSQIITRNLSLSEVLESITRAGMELFKGDVSRIFLVDETSKNLILRASHGEIPSPVEGALHFEPGEGIIGRLFQTGKAVILPDVQKEPLRVTANWAREYGVHSFIAQPLRLGDEVIGIINCFSREIDFFNKDDLGILGALASQAAVEIKNARLHEKEKRSRIFLNSVVSDSADAIVVSSAERKIIPWNASAERLFGYSEKETIGKHIHLIIPEGEIEETESRMARLIQSGEAYVCESFRMRKDGSLLPVNITVSPVKQDDGKTIAYSTIYQDLTERREAERALRDSEERHRTLLENHPDGVGLVTEGKIVYANPAMEKLMGYTSEEMVGCSPADFQVPEDRERAAERIKELYQGASTALGEYRLVRKDGTVFYGEILSRILQYAGKPTLLSIFWDVTQRREAEAALRESEERFRVIAEASPIPMLVSRVSDGAFLFWNHALETSFNYSKEEIASRKTVDFYYHPSDRQALLDKLSEKGFVRNHELRAKRPDGTPYWVAVSLKNITFDGEEAVFAALYDISERKKSEQALRESEERFRQLVEQATDAFIVSEKEGRFVDVNQRACDILGYSREELLDLTIQDIKADFDPEEIARMREELRPGAAITWYGEYRRKDGSTFPVEIRLGTFEFGGKKLFLASARDITERKQIEERLRQSQKMEAIGELAAGVAHDFNNILTSILGFTDLTLKGGRLTERAQKNLEQVLSASRRGRSLVGQILSFSRQTSRKRSLIRLASVVEEVLYLVRASLPATIEIHYEAEDEAGTIFADMTEAHQVIMNLCANAGHAMRKKGGLLDVHLSRFNVDRKFVNRNPGITPGPFLKLTIRDVGCGMEPGVVERIFDPFFTTKEVGEGSGMGLAVVHGIVADLGGAITVQSQPGEGSTFEVFFPEVKKEDLEEKKEEYKGVTPPVKGRVLFVDDEGPIVDLAEQMLNLLGFEVDSCFSGAEALERFQAQPMQYDLVITDQIMPMMNGDALLKELKRVREDVTVLLTTGYSQYMTRDSIKEMGFQNLITKPFTVEDLGAVIRKTLNS